MKKIKKLIVSKKWWVVVILILLLGVGLVLRKRSEDIAEEKNKTELVKVKRGDLQRAVVLSGQVEVREKANLRFQTSGLLSWVGVKKGDWVKEYQVLASLDKQELQKTFQKEMYDYVNERHDFEQGEDDYEHTERWFELSDEVKRILQKNQNDLSRAVLDVELADLAVKYATLVTPIEGLVTSVDTPYAGVNITPATAEFQVVNPYSIYFSAQADEEEVVGLGPGMAAAVSLDAYPDREFFGTIERVAFTPVSAGTSPNYEVEVSFGDYDNQDLGLRLGMEGEAEIILFSRENVLVIPVEALRGNNEDWVYVMVNGEKEKREIVKGLETEDEVEIVSGLIEGELVLVE